MNLPSHPTILAETGGAQQASPRGRLMSGMDALVEGILAHRRQDQDVDTATFISGYRGSPLGAFDSLLWKRRDELTASAVTFKPGLNEDLAATACWGTQQLELTGDPKYSGVTAFWYGKGPGVDRSGDVLKHANTAGTMPLGGVVMLVGDDHGAKSSTVAHQSDQALMAAGIPVLYPATIQEYVDLLPAAVELSRQSGLWVAFKCVTETLEGSGLVETGGAAQDWVTPDYDSPLGGFHIGSGFQPLNMEELVSKFRLPAAAKFVAANRLDRTMLDSPMRSLGIVAPGKSYVDVIEALRLLGLGSAEAAELGIRIYKPLMVWPLVGDTIAEFCRGHREILVVEEKRRFVEEQLAGVLLRMGDAERPTLTGKQCDRGELLLKDFGELDALQVAKAIGSRLIALGLAPEPVERRWQNLFGGGPRSNKPLVPRMPAFCSGCPHNRSTRLPDGSMALGGIGCHGMALFVPELRTPSATHMGGEGANWIGLSDYVETDHIFQNLGEGTYAHSGILAVRAAVDAKVNITYKILFNSATAMTGGQPVEGEFSVEDLAHQLVAEGVGKVVLLTEYPDLARSLPPSVNVYARTELDRIQRELREIPGVTALIYEQGCAAERRRLRKRNEHPDPPVRTYINPEVCEGCGDCGKKSSCVSLMPLETEFGTKRAVDQESCNKDYTCVEGFCPSFVTVKGGAPRVAKIDAAMAEAAGRALEGHAPEASRQDGNLLVAGIGGTGTITLGLTMARAAIAEGKRVSVFDVTGLAQKNGPVYSHLRVLPGDDQGQYQPRIPPAQLDTLIGCDIATAAAETVFPLIEPSRSRAFLSTSLVPVAAFQRDPGIALNSDDYAAALASALPPDRMDMVAFGERASRLLGKGALRNIAVVGFALQKGAIPISAQSIEAQMVRGGEKDIASIFALRLGRLAAIDPDRAEEVAGTDALPVPERLDTMPTAKVIARCREVLTEYQNDAYADRYEQQVRAVEASDPGTDLTQAFAVNLFKLMRYKDEYEVARLFSEPQFLEGLKRDFSGDPKLEFNLAPPLLAWRKTSDGEPRKMKFGSWMLPAFGLLAKLKFLRGTPFDPFGRTHDRKMEREILQSYRIWVFDALSRLNGDNYDTAAAIARLPEDIRGYGPVKDRAIDAARARYAVLAEQL